MACTTSLYSLYLYMCLYLPQVTDFAIAGNVTLMASSPQELQRFIDIVCESSTPVMNPLIGMVLLVISVAHERSQSLTYLCLGHDE